MAVVSSDVAFFRRPMAVGHVLAERPVLGLGLLLLLLLVGAPGAARGEIVKDAEVRFRATQPAPVTAVRFHRFGFERGGTMDFAARLSKVEEDSSSIEASLSETRPRFYFLACLDKEWDAVFDQHRDTATFCPSLELGNVDCQIVVPANGTVMDVERTVTAEGLYVFVLTNCFGLEAVVRVSYTLLNPEGEHLGTGYQPLPSMFLVFCFVWPLVALAAAVSLLAFRRTVTRLHAVAALLPYPQLAYVSIAAYNWKTCRETGNCSGNTLVVICGALAISTARGLFWVIVLMVTKGHSLLQSKLDMTESRLLPLYFFLVFASSMLSQVFGDFFLVTYLMSHIAVVWLAFRSISVALRRVREQYAVVREAGIDPHSTPLVAKERLVLTIQSTLIALVILSVTTFFYGSFFAQNQQWVESLINEVITLVTYSALVGILFFPLLRGDHRASVALAEGVAGNAAAQQTASSPPAVDFGETPGNPAAARNRDRRRRPRRARTWVFGSPVEDMEGTVLPQRLLRAHEPLVIIQHPSGQDDDGKASVAYSIGNKPAPEATMTWEGPEADADANTSWAQSRPPPDASASAGGERASIEMTDAGVDGETDARPPPTTPPPTISVPTER